MSWKKRILAGIFALLVGLTLIMPVRALADDWQHHDHDRDHHAWQWHDHDRDRDHHHDRDRHYDHGRNYHPGYRPGYAYGNRGRSIPPNGQGLVNQRNPNLYWACDSEGHHCHWAPRR
jgi:Ni/Co efflux regulator RcnB